MNKPVEPIRNQVLNPAQLDVLDTLIDSTLYHSLDTQIISAIVGLIWLDIYPQATSTGDVFVIHLLSVCYNIFGHKK